MISIALVSESQILKETLEHLTRLLGWECMISQEEVKDSYTCLNKEVIIAGHHSRKINIKETLSLLRRKNPHTPVIFVSPDLTEADSEQSQNLIPLNICKWPYSSSELAGYLEIAIDNAPQLKDTDKIRKELETALEEGQAVKAEACLDQLKEKIPEYPFSILAARCNLITKNFDEAMSAAKKAVSLEPELPDSVEVMAMVQNAMGARKESLATLDHHKELLEKDAGLLVLKADTLLEDGRFTEAKENYTMALGISPRSEAARQGKFLAGVMDGSVTAISGGKGATQTSIELAKLCNNRAISFVRAKEFEVAETLYQNTIRILPDKRLEYKLWMNLGLCMKKSQNWAKALEYFNKGKSSAPDTYNRFEEQITAMERMLDSIK